MSNENSPIERTTVSFERPDQVDVIALISALDAYQDALYPAEARYALDVAALSRANVLFAVARTLSGEAIGCGAVVLHPEYGELKRMYLQPDMRGTGAATQLLTALEAAVAEQGCRVLMLETGPYQIEALAFYRKLGFVPCDPFGDYPAHELSVFMSKRISAEQSGPKLATIHNSPAVPADCVPAHVLRRSKFVIDQLRVIEREADYSQLAETLIESVAGGGSISFMHPVSHEKAMAFWAKIAQGVVAGERILLVARDEGGRIVGTVQSAIDLPENQPHRADIAKMMVHPRARRQGVAESLMREIERLTFAAGKTLMVLDTETGAAASHLYAKLGWSVAGHIPDFALKPHGGFCSTTYMFKRAIGA
jgi:GNAT superfamily N-acetyltransferase